MDTRATANADNRSIIGAIRMSDILTCAVCGDKLSAGSFPEVHCEHNFCPNCLKSLFDDWLETAAQSPPTCCGRIIPAEGNAERCLGGDAFWARYRVKEASVYKDGEVYCHVPRCSEKITPEEKNERGVAVCGKCSAVTCVRCKGAAHENQPECPPMTEAAEQIWKLVEEEGWQECYRCHTLVSLSDGCKHISKCHHRTFAPNSRFLETC